jgi:hypothetical protein
MARADAQAAAEEAAGIKRMSAFGAIADIGHCIVPMNYNAIDPIPQCSGLGRGRRGLGCEDGTPVEFVARG